MEISEFARKVLFSCDLEEKLLSCENFTDLQPFHSEDLPSIPGRPPALSLDRWRTAKKVGFPTQSELLDPSKVGLLLHFFANHELLALELMALALLKFPEAPSAFRMGVIKTMHDEQRHLTAYLSKMKELGVTLGDVPVNDFFWSQCASMRTPLDYVSRMSLTFEQANLDFAAYFRDVLLQIGDTKTASLMQTVLDDEIGHVKHGLVWFRRWKPELKTDWQAFCEALGAEINPARAKGTVFQAESRLRAGFDDDFIQSLRVYSQSKGGLSRVSFYNPEAEEEIRLGSGRPVLSRVLENVGQDLSPVMLFVSNQSDILMLPKEPPRDFLIGLSAVGFDLPEIIVSPVNEKCIKDSLKERRIAGLNPWAVTPWTLGLEGHFKQQNLATYESRNRLRSLYSKSNALEILKEFLNQTPFDERVVCADQIGEVVTCKEEFLTLIERFVSLGLTGQFLAKRPWSASGRHRYIGVIAGLAWHDHPLSMRNWLEKSWRLGEAPVVQPLFKRVFDVSVQARIDSFADRSDVHVLGQTRVLNLANGQYAGSCVGRMLSGLDDLWIRFWHGRTTSLQENLDEYLTRTARFVGEKLVQQGYAGPFGIDAFVFQSNNGSLKLFPLIEINPRYTMGRIALSLAKRMSPGRVGLWLHVQRNVLERNGLSTFAELREKWRELFPLKTQTKSGGTVIISGLLETSPAENASQLWTCFVVGSDAEKMRQSLGMNDSIVINENVQRFGMPETRL